MVFVVVAWGLAVQSIRTNSEGLHFYGKNEIVMAPGMAISAKTSLGTIKVKALNPLVRAYTWEGATRQLEMEPRGERWYGSLGLYFPGPGDHWQEHNGITRAVVEEGQQNFSSIAGVQKFIKERRYLSLVYRNDGLLVGWAKVLERRQLNVDVWQILLNGKKPKHLPGADDRAITVSLEAAKTAPLVAAVQRGDAAKVETLLKAGADPNQADAGGMVPVVAVLEKGNAAIMKELLEAKANPNATAPDGGPVLGLAALMGNVEMARLLLEHGANPNARTNMGMPPGETPLALGLLSAPSLEMVRLLLDHGADPNIEDAQGTTALAEVGSKGSGPHSAEIAQLLIEHKAQVEHSDWTGNTPLMSAATFGNTAVLKVLIEHGADVNHRSDAARTMVRGLAIAGGGKQDEDAVKKLQKSGRLDHLHQDGVGPLDMARSPEVQALLKAKGAKSFQAEFQKVLGDLGFLK